MNYAAPELSITDIENGRLGAPSKWADPLKRLIAEGLVDAETCKWTNIGALHSDQFARQLRKERGKGPFAKLLSVWSGQLEKFDEGTDTDVSRLVNPGCFSPLDLCDFHLLMPEKIRLENYISWVRKLFDDRRRQESVGNIVKAIGTALRKAAKVADDAWDAIWCGGDQTLQKTVEDIKNTIRSAIEDALPQSDFFWITESKAALPDKSGRVFLVEMLGGERNFARRIPSYTISIVAADVTGAGGLGFRPICAGVYVPSLQHLYLGVPGDGGGAILIDERLTAVHKLGGLSQGIGSERVTVGIHHSRNEVLLSNQFVNLVSCLLPSWVDKELATGAGAWSLAMTASGSLAAYFESSISWPAAYAGAVLLYAATGREDAATDLTGANWVEGDPTRKRGILAWGHTGLKSQIGQAVSAGCRVLSTMRA